MKNALANVSQLLNCVKGCGELRSVYLKKKKKTLGKSQISGAASTAVY